MHVLIIQCWVQLRNRVVKEDLELRVVEGTPSDLIERIARERYLEWFQNQINGGWEILEEGS